MPKIIKDISKEKPDAKQAEFQPESFEEAPAKVEIEKKIEVAEPVAIEEVQEAKEGKEITAAVPKAAEPVRVPSKSQVLEKIEDILEEDLEEIYFKMPAAKQEEFKKVGEETATRIEILLRETKIKIRKILDLIRKWLKIIPGINKFFLEQEAKIKIDKILDIKETGQLGQEGEKENSKNQNKI